MFYNKVLEFKASSATKTKWSLSVDFVNCNTYGMFAVKTVDGNERIVGHFSEEVIRIRKLIIDRGANVQARLIGIHYRSSPLV